MKMRQISILAVTAGLCVAPALFARQNLLKNGSMENGPGRGGLNPQIAATWIEFGTNVERSPTVNLQPPGAGHALKAFGDANSSGTVGARQDVLPVNPGQQITASVWVHTPSFDKLGGTGQAGILVQCLGSFGQVLATQQTYPLTAASAANTWILAGVGPFNAPASTVSVRVQCRLNWNGAISGAAYWDDAQVSINGGSNLIVNGDFETAGLDPGQSPAGIDDWSGFNDQEKSNLAALDGGFSLQLGTREAYSGLYQNMKALEDGDRIVLLAYARHPSSDPLEGNSRAGLKLEFSPNSQAPPPQESLTFDENDPLDTWTLVELDTVVPAEVTLARVVCIYNATPGTTGEVYFDAAFAERSSAPGVQQLFNASFEDGPGSANGIDLWTEFGDGALGTCQKSCFPPIAIDGSCTARANGPPVSGVFQAIPVTTGETLSLSVFVRTPSGAPLTGTGTAGIKVEWVQGSVPGWVDIGTACSSPNTIGACAAADTWHPITIDYTMPPGSNAITRFVCLIEKGNADSGRVYFDACEAVAVNVFDGCDADCDDDEDMHDAAQFQLCFSGTGNPRGWNCLVNDSNDDNDVDIADWSYFHPRMTGPN